MAIQKTQATIDTKVYSPRDRYRVGKSVLKNSKIYQNVTGGNGDPESSNDWMLINSIFNSYIEPDYYIHNWNRNGQHYFNLTKANNVGNSSISMEADGLGSAYYITFYFKTPVLISKLIYVNGSITSLTNGVREFKLLGSTDALATSFPITEPLT